MRKAHVVKLLKKVGLIGMALNLMAFTSPEKGDLFELRGLFYARKDSKTFLKNVDTNKIMTLPKGTRAVVEEVARKESGNAGVCLKVLNVAKPDLETKCVWVYWDRNEKNLEFYSAKGNSQKHKELLEAWSKDPKINMKGQKISAPEVKAAAEVQKTTQGFPEQKSKVDDKPAATQSASAPTASATPTSSPAPKTKVADAKTEKQTASSDTKSDLQTGTETTVAKIDSFNKNAQNSMSSANQVCPTGNCIKPKIEGYQTCNSKNGYLESAIDRLLTSSPYSEFYKAPQKELIKMSCIKENMSWFDDNTSYYQNCTVDKNNRRVVRRNQGKACISEDYVNVNSKAFNLAADCLSSYVSGNEETKGQTALSIFSLMAQESGMHVNAVSGTGPGGPGQMSGPAIAHANRLLKGVRKHLESQSNPNCTQVLGKVLEKPMNPSGVCERISTEKDNPIKGMAYAFIYQSVTRQTVKSLINVRLYPKVLGELDPIQLERLAAELSAWGHNTGPGGIETPVRAQLTNYAGRGKALRTAADVDDFLKMTRTYMMSNPNPKNHSAKRIDETRNYYGLIQGRLAKFTKDRNACLAN